MAKVMIEETGEDDPLFAQLAKGARTSELKTLGNDLVDHENGMRDWFKSELDGKSDGGEKIFAYLQRHGITREDAVTPRELREDVGGVTQQLVLAFFASEDAADQAAKALRGWEKASDAGHAAVGVLTWDFETKAVADKLTELGGTPETHEVASVAEGH